MIGLMTLDKKSKETAPKKIRIGSELCWFILICILSLPPLISIGYRIHKDSGDQKVMSITLMVPESFTIDSCLTKKNSNCLSISRSIEHTKDELKKIKNELENNVSNSLRAYDKNIDILTFSLSLYAVLITVISLFFSFRESQRIDKGLEDMDIALSKVNSKLENIEETNNQLNNKLKEVDDKLKEVDDKLQEVNNRLDNKLQEVNNRLDNKLQEVNNRLDNKLQEVNNRLDNKLKEVNNRLDNKLQEVNNRLDNKLQEVNNRLDNKLKEVDDKLREANQSISQLDATINGALVGNDTDFRTKQRSEQNNTFNEFPQYDKNINLSLEDTEFKEDKLDKKSNCEDG